MIDGEKSKTARDNIAISILNWSFNILKKITIDRIVKQINVNEIIYSGLLMNLEVSQINIVYKGWLSPESSAQKNSLMKTTLNSETSSC